MADNFDQMAEQLLNSTSKAKLVSKKGQLEKLANSSDGEKIKELIGDGGEDIKKAFAKGDTDALKSMVANILKTEEGARIAKQLSDMMK